MNCDNSYSDSCDFDEILPDVLSANQTEVLVNSLKILGLSTIQANICISLLLRGNLPISGFMMHSNGSKTKLNESLDELKSLGFISEYQDKARNKRITKYYQLEKSPNEIYDYFKQKSSDKLSLLEKIYGDLCEAFDSPDKFNITIECLNQLGIEREYAKILVALEFNCYEEVFGKKPVFNTTFRPLSETDWIYTNRKNIVCLKHNVKEIAQEYIDMIRDGIGTSLENLLKFLNIIDNENTPIHCTRDTVAVPIDKRRLSHSKGTKFYNELFYRALSDIVTSYSNLERKPLTLELKPPYPEKIRVYLYKNGASKRHISEKSKEYKTVLRLPSQKYGEVGKLDFSDVTLVILGGYCPDKNVFVFWDSWQHMEFAFNTNLQAREQSLDDAEVLGMATYSRKLSNDSEEVIVARPDYLKKALSKLYDNYYNHLMREDL